MSSDQSTAARICPECGRRVPRRIEQCRCGFGIGLEADLPDGPVAVRARSTAPLWAIAVIAVLGLTTFLLWPRTGREVDFATEVKPAVVSVAAVTASDAEAVVETPGWPTNVPYLTRPVSTETVGEAIAEPTAARPAAEGPPSLERAAAAVLPAVVSVETPGGRGTGFLVSADTALTNAHVVEGNAYVTLQFGSGETVSARVSATAPEHDLAVLRLSSGRANLRPLVLGELAGVSVGQEVLAVGSPLGLRNTVTRGIVSAVRRVGPVVLVQTDAAINPGNSGGPLVDGAGRVIGIATMKVAGGAESLGFAVAADHARALIDTGTARLASGRMPAGASTDVMPPPTDGVETARAQGAVQFEKAMALASRRADALDDYWRQFAKTCLTRPARTGGDRAWFAIWERSFATDAVAPACVADFRSFSSAADVLRAAVMDADEAARQAGVYPGSRRELLTRYRLAWDGWES